MNKYDLNVAFWAIVMFAGLCLFVWSFFFVMDGKLALALLSFPISVIFMAVGMILSLMAQTTSAFTELTNNV